MEFKIGDKVIVKEGSSFSYQRKSYGEMTVTHVYTSVDYDIRTNKNVYRSKDLEFFKPSSIDEVKKEPTTPFKIGDKITSNGTPNGYTITTGDWVGTVEKFEKVSREGCWMFAGGHWVNPIYFELYTPTGKFKVGDRIIGNSKANIYGHTVEGWIGIVTALNPYGHDDGNDLIEVEEEGRKGNTFNVDSHRFDLHPTNTKTPRSIVGLKKGDKVKYISNVGISTCFAIGDVLQLQRDAPDSVEHTTDAERISDSVSQCCYAKQLEPEDTKNVKPPAPSIGDIIVVSSDTNIRVMKVKTLTSNLDTKIIATGPYIKEGSSYFNMSITIWDKYGTVNFTPAVEQDLIDHVNACADADKFVAFKDIPKDIPKRALAGFPKHGWCPKANSTLGRWLALRFDQSFIGCGSKGYAWNDISYWSIDTASGKDPYDWGVILDYITLNPIGEEERKAPKKSKRKYKVGDIVVITCTIRGHNFKKGERVKITYVERDASSSKNPYKGNSMDTSEGGWWFGDDECTDYIEVVEAPIPKDLFPKFKFKEGEKVIVARNSNSHGITIGSTVILPKGYVNSEGNVRYNIKVGRLNWVLQEEDCDRLKPAITTLYHVGQELMIIAIGSHGFDFGDTVVVKSVGKIRSNPQYQCFRKGHTGVYWVKQSHLGLITTKKKEPSYRLDVAGVVVEYLEGHPVPKEQAYPSLPKSIRISKDPLVVEPVDAVLKSRIVKPVTKTVTKSSENKGLIVPLETIKSRIIK